MRLMVVSDPTNSRMKRLAARRSRRDGLPFVRRFPPPCPVPLGHGREVGVHQLVVGGPLLHRDRRAPGQAAQVRPDRRVGAVNGTLRVRSRTGRGHVIIIAAGGPDTTWPPHAPSIPDPLHETPICRDTHISAAGAAVDAGARAPK
jgi:hypothetical protein